jgi:ATP-dependent DNA ligase
VIAKRRGSPYEHRRSKLWLKMKIEASQEFVVGAVNGAGLTARRFFSF